MRSDQARCDGSAREIPQATGGFTIEVKILVEQVPPDLTEHLFQAIFEVYGQVAAVQIRPPFAAPWLPNHSAIVDMPDPAEGELAIKCLRGAAWCGVEHVNVKALKA